MGAVINGKTGYAKPQRVAPAAPATVDVATPKALVVGGSGSSSRDREKCERGSSAKRTTSPGFPRRRPSRASTRQCMVTGLSSGTGEGPGKFRKGKRQHQLCGGEEPCGEPECTACHHKLAPEMWSASQPPRRMRTVALSRDRSISWQVIGAGAAIYPDGTFVAEEAGTYVIKATSGGRDAGSSVVVSPRNADRQLHEIVAHVMPKDTQTTEQWIVIGNYAYLAL